MDSNLSLHSPHNICGLSFKFKICINKICGLKKKKKKKERKDVTTLRLLSPVPHEDVYLRDLECCFRLFINECSWILKPKLVKFLQCFMKIAFAQL